MALSLTLDVSDGHWVHIEDRGKLEVVERVGRRGWAVVLWLPFDGPPTPLGICSKGWTIVSKDVRIMLSPHQIGGTRRARVRIDAPKNLAIRHAKYVRATRGDA